MAGPSERFLSVSNEDIEKLVEDAKNVNTARATSVWLRAVTEFREEKGSNISFALCSAEELNDFLCLFYAQLKPKRGEVYSRSSYLAARAAVQRHVNVLKRPFNIFKDSAFQRSNEVLNAVLVKKKKDGTERQVKHKSAISADDLRKLQEYFKNATSEPRKLTEYCWFLMTVHFCLRGQELQGNLKKTDIVFEQIAGAGASGSTTVRLGTDYLSKNCPGGLKAREFATAGRITAPEQVRAIQKLIEKGNPEVDRVFQRAHPSFSGEESVWFMKCALGHNLLSEMMRRISQKAALSKLYTNHCLRATCISTLMKAGFSDNQICAVSGHKNASSLAVYSRPDEERCEEMASAIDIALRQMEDDGGAAASKPEESARSESTAEPTTSESRKRKQPAPGVNVIINNYTYPGPPAAKKKRAAPTCKKE